MTETARDLVKQMVAAGDWPEPTLLEAIAARGEEAIEPLLEVVRRDVEDWDEQGEPLFNSIGLLGVLNARSAIPDLLEMYRRYDDDVLEDVSQVLGTLGGAEVAESALAIGRDPTLPWYPRAMAFWAAILASGDDPAQRARIAETLRELLADLVARAPALEGDEFELASSLVTDLAELADPQARDLIQAAFEADIVDRFFIGPKDVEQLYHKRGRVIKSPEPWLDKFRRQYQQHQDFLAREAERAREAPRAPERRPAPVLEEPTEYIPPVTEPIRNTGPKLGRNDPCRCGSGKKYKKCHMRQDQDQV